MKGMAAGGAILADGRVGLILDVPGWRCWRPKVGGLRQKMFLPQTLSEAALKP